MSTDVTIQPSFFSRLLQDYHKTALTVVRSRVTWIVFVIMLLAIIYMIAIGQTNLMISGLTSLVFNFILAIITIPLTLGKPPAPWENPPLTYSRRRLEVQIAVALLVILLLNIGLILLYDLLGLRNAHIPLLSSLTTFMYNQTIHHNYLFVLTILVFLETLLPLSLMRLLGARWPELGFCKGYHVWRTAFAWSFIYLLLFAFALFLGKISFIALLGSIFINFFLDGLTEETLFRGTLQTRLTQLWGVAWGIGLSGLIFGVAHFSTTMHSLHNNVPLSLAFVMIHYGLNGIFAAFFFLRTRSLTALVISHTLGDAAIPLLSLLGGS